MSKDKKTPEQEFPAPEIITEVNAETIVERPSDTIDVKGLLHNYLRHWYWFLISLIICGGLGWAYMKKKSPVFLSKTVIMLNQNNDEANNLSGISALASQFGFGGARNGASANVSDEIIRLRSEKLLGQVVAASGMNVNSWSVPGLLKHKRFYFDDAPFSIRAPQEVLDTMGTPSSFLIDVKSDGRVHLTVKQRKKTVLDTDIPRFPFTARTPVATFVVDTTRYFKPRTPLEFHAFAANTAVVIENIRSEMAVEELDKKGNAIYIDLASTCPPRAENFLNTLVGLYNEGRYNQKLDRRKEALAFVEERLVNLYKELEASETQIEDFKRENKIVDAQAEAEYLFTRKGAIEGASTQTRTELEIYKMVRDMLSSPKTRYSLLPFASAGDESGSGNALAAAVGSYNELVLKRMELESGVKGQSGAMDRLTQQIDALRENILATLSREIQAKKIALAAVDREGNVSDNRITEIPYMEKRLTQLYRDREVKNAIYAFLLQKREEAEIAVQQVEPISEVIDPAYTGPRPISPNSMLVYAVSLVFGIVLPLIFVKLLCKPRRKEAGKEAVMTTPSERVTE